MARFLETSRRGLIPKRTGEVEAITFLHLPPDGIIIVARAVVRTSFPACRARWKRSAY